MKLLKQTFIVVTSTLSLFGAGAYLVAKEMQEYQVIETARNTANYVRDVGSWASQYGTVYTNDYKSAHLAEKKVAEFIPENITKPFTEEDMKTISFFSKNPSLIQREVADVVAKSDNSVKFKLTAENYMNPNNKPNDWEYDAIQTIKSKRLDEYGAFINGNYFYARTIYMKASCLKCHGDPATAPEGVTKQYGTVNGFGFSEGAVSGIISVKVPLSSGFKIEAFLKSFYGVLAIFFFITSFIIPVVAVYMKVIRPIRKEVGFISMLNSGKVTQEALERSTKNENSEVTDLRNVIAALCSKLTGKKSS